MLLFKNSALTMHGVIKNQMHASNGQPKNAKKGDIILIAQTKGTLKKNEKPIRWVMNFEYSKRDDYNVSDEIWGKHWNYLIIGSNLRPVEPFDIDELKVSDKNYASVMTFCEIEDEDEEIILEWIDDTFETETSLLDVEAEEFDLDHELDINDYIKKLDEKYRGKPKFKEVLIKAIQRPSALSNAIKRKYGYECMICGYPGFEKKNGDKYAEVHHVYELYKKAPQTLQSWNLIVVCPLCHKKLHYADVNYEWINPGWKIVLDDEEHYIKNNEYRNFD